MSAASALEDRTTVVAYDGSPASKRALLHAADLVGRGGHVTVVNVIPAQSVSARLETVSEAQRTRQEHLLREARELLARHDVDALTVAAVGDPLAEILAAADAAGAAILVAGRSASRARHLLRRSVSLRLVRAASCDVLVVH